MRAQTTDNRRAKWKGWWRIHLFSHTFIRWRHRILLSPYDSDSLDI